jgi:hypothetical protein
MKLIPRDKIKHLEWNPENGTPNPLVVTPPNIPAGSPQSAYTIEQILNGKPFYDAKLPVSLKQSLEYATPEGIVATMPELIAAKILAGKEHIFWKDWYSVHTEENIGVDKKGNFYSKNDPVLVVVNGGGILTPDRIQKAYDEGLINNSAKYSNEEFNDLLEGKLPDGSSIQLYRFEEIKAGASSLPHKFGVVIPYSMAQATKSGYHKKDAFISNPLVIARVGGIENLEKYYDLAKASDGDLGCYHPFSGRDASVPRGRLLFLNNDYYGLDGLSNLIDNGRFVGVAPEAPSAKK